MCRRTYKTGKYGPFRGHASVERAVTALAASQHVVFDLDQLCELGLTASAVRKRASSGRFHRIYQAVYSLVPRELLTRDGRFMAAVLACGPGAVLSHRSAAWLHGLLRTDRENIEVTVPRSSARPRPGIDIYCSATLTAADTTRVNNIPCAAVARTLLDIAGVLPQRRVERAFDQAETLQVFDLRAVRDQLARNPTRPGAALVKKVLQEHYVGSTLTWSELEEKFVSLCRSADLPAPEVNQLIVLDDGGPPIRVDFLWRTQRVVVETDGHAFHRTRQSFENDRRRDQRLTLAGRRIIRVTWRQIETRPREVRETIRGLLGLTP
jgi:hypothetical protein